MPYKSLFPNARNLVECHSGAEALQHVIRIYNNSKKQIEEFFLALQEQEDEDLQNIVFQGACYPFIGIHIPPSNMHIDARLS